MRMRTRCLDDMKCCWIFILFNKNLDKLTYVTVYYYFYSFLQKCDEHFKHMLRFNINKHRFKKFQQWDVYR